MGTTLQILFPVFGLILMGSVLGYFRFMDEAMEKAFNKFCYYVSLPVLIVLKAAQSPIPNHDALESSLSLLLITLGLMVAGFIFAIVIRLPARSRGTFIQSSFRGNLAYIGLPVIAFALAGQPEHLRSQAESLAILTMAPGVLFYNLLGVMVLEWDRRGEREQHPLKGWLRSTLTNPLIIACIIGFSWNLLRIPFPRLLERIGNPLAATAFPLALLAIGARIANLSWKEGLIPSLSATFLKNFLGLVLGLLACRFFLLEGIHRLVILVLSVCPTAVASYVLVDQLNGDRDLSAATIAISTLGSLIALSLALFIALPL